jgi:hypothetical protein
METSLRGDKEGNFTRSVEVQTSRIPSINFLGLAVGSMIASAGLMFAGRRETANFIGQWAPTLLVIGVYNKLVKIEKELGVTYH